MKTAELQLRELHEGQQTAFDQAARFNVLECGRRFGKSALGEELAIDTAIKGGPVGWFAPNYSYLADVWDNLIRTLAPVIANANKTEKRIKLVTGGSIDFWTIDNPDAGRGRKYQRVIIDEAGIARNLKIAWEASIRPTLTDLRGDAWILGTPKGHSYFHQLYSRGEQGFKGWKSWRLPTIANPIISKAEVEEARQSLPPTVFDQEFLGIPADDGGNPFDLAAIRRCVKPMSTGAMGPAAFGIDLAKSHDWTVVLGLDRAGNTCSLDRWQGSWESQIERINGLINGWPALVDATGVGDPIVERLQKRPGNRVEGFKFSSTSKQQIMEGLAVAIQRGEVSFPDGWLVDELESFQYEYTATGVRYSAPEGLHDDGVCALALAAHHLGKPQTFVGVLGGYDSQDEAPDIW